ncbi:MAG: hypothetical protein L6R39_002242 [Caloplaca ligustica]|nr:MAG: hypothetical protein L6R39_002242 [Caloplaca ligustica]
MDNSETMWKHKARVEGVLQVLAYLTKAWDDNSLEIHFTQSKHTIKSRRSTEIVNAVDQVQYIGTSDMGERLQNILQEHICRFGKFTSPSKSILGRQRPPQPQKPLSIYVLTDAKWQPTGVSEAIKDVIQKMKDKGLPDEHTAIQFIRFGKEEASIDKLNRLVHDLNSDADGMYVTDNAP